MSLGLLSSRSTPLLIPPPLTRSHNLSPHTIAGLQILRISNKPTAATITYGFDKATQRVSDYRCHIAFRSSTLAASLQQLPKPTITYGFDKAAHHRLARLAQFNFFVPMALKIEWNRLYSAKKTQRPFVLWEQNVTSASIRPTGWHGEGGLERWGHLTVDFHEENGVHVTTHHVYPTEGAYRFSTLGELDPSSPISHLVAVLPVTSLSHYHRCCRRPSSPLYRVTVAAMIAVT
ncbi:hypothetical protein EDB83DRAFT_2320329 [Lactarius deliciosus]|nr:hypothetical protein EDB83DRAFT_2321346 [Lactarius deliciosus]KAH9022389.1 hypothetical protein EDB83DRAFT_2320329 [Lactarius deliciosus]